MHQANQSDSVKPGAAWFTGSLLGYPRHFWNKLAIHYLKCHHYGPCGRSLFLPWSSNLRTRWKPPASSPELGKISISELSTAFRQRRTASSQTPHQWESVHSLCRSVLSSCHVPFTPLSPQNPYSPPGLFAQNGSSFCWIIKYLWSLKFPIHSILPWKPSLISLPNQLSLPVLLCRTCLLHFTLISTCPVVPRDLHISPSSDNWKRMLLKECNFFLFDPDQLIVLGSSV